MTTKIANNKHVITVDGESVIVGKDTNTFSPEITMFRFGEECSLKLYEPTFNGNPLSQKNAGSELVGDVIRWASKDLQFLFHQDGNSFEYEIVIANSKAGTNQLLDSISFPISYNNLEFYYQPPLTPQEIAEGAIRPDNVVGSYAVYHATRTSMHRSKADADKYKCGKAFHIYRPKLIDNTGDTAWADLLITGNALTISFTNIAQWLEKAKYPVIIDPNFGYDTGKLGTTVGLTGYLRAMQAVLSENGTVETITEWVENLSAVTTRYIKLAIYDESTSLPYNLEFESANTAVAPLYDNWKTCDVPDTLLSAGTYWLAFQQNNNDLQVFFDTGGLRSTRLETWGAFPDPYGASTTASYTYSIYATYAVAGGATYYQATGGALSTITGVIGKGTSKSMGLASMAIAGALASVATFYKSITAGAVSIAGTLTKGYFQVAGAASMAIAGTLGAVKLVTQIVGEASIAIVGSVGRVKTAFKTVGSGAVSLVGTLATQFTAGAGIVYQAVGSATMSIIGACVLIIPVTAKLYRKLTAGKFKI